jgi:predicted DNA-binding transcriptional regulator AlpA
MQRKILTYPELESHGVRLSRRQIDRKEAEGDFPKRIPISDRRVGWLEDEIDEHVDRTIASRSTEVGKLGSFDARRRLAEIPEIENT